MDFFKKKNSTKEANSDKATTKPVEAPYLNQRRRWNDHTSSVVSQRNMWMVLCLLMGIITLFSVGGLIKIGSQSKFVPYIIEVDQLGSAAAVHPAYQAHKADIRVIKSTVASFISQARIVTPDVELQRKAIFGVYANLIPGDSATNKMSEHLNGNPESNPFKRAASETVSVEILSVIPQTETTFQVDWIETVRDRTGILTEEPFRMKALVTVTVIEPTSDTSEENIRLNPLGIYITEYNWSKTL